MMALVSIRRSGEGLCRWVVASVYSLSLEARTKNWGRQTLRLSERSRCCQPKNAAERLDFSILGLKEVFIELKLNSFFFCPHHRYVRQLKKGMQPLFAFYNKPYKSIENGLPGQVFLLIIIFIYPIPCSYTSLQLDGTAMNYLSFYMSGLIVFWVLCTPIRMKNEVKMNTYK